MTGMPAWGVTHDDEELWPVVAFLARWAEAGDARARQLLVQAEASGAGHHHAEASAESGPAREPQEGASETDAGQEHEGHAHEH